MTKILNVNDRCDTIVGSTLDEHTQRHSSAAWRLPWRGRPA